MKNYFSLFMAVLFLGFAGELKAYDSFSLVGVLKNARNRTSIDLTRHERDIDEQIKSVVKITTRDVLSAQSDQIMAQVRETIESGLDKKAEERLRNDFWDQLIHQVSSHYKRDDPLNEYFRNTCLELARTALSSTDVNSQYWFFLVNLAVALQTQAEKIEDPVRFIESYLQYSTILEPKAVSGFRVDDGYL